MQAGSKKATVMPAEPSGRPPAEERVPLSYDSLHDLVGPINQISSLTGLLLKQYGDRLGPDAEVMIGLLQSSVNRLQNLLAGFRTYTRIVNEKGPMQLC